MKTYCVLITRSDSLHCPCRMCNLGRGPDVSVQATAVLRLRAPTPSFKTRRYLLAARPSGVCTHAVPVRSLTQTSVYTSVLRGVRKRWSSN